MDALAKLGHAFDEGLGVGVLRVGQHFASGSRFDDFASEHDRYTVGDSADDGEVVGDQDHRHVELLFQEAKLVEDLFLDGDVERGGRFICDQ